ncbi:MAG TPA: hypothetical protein VFE62_30610 [Gemmataceae bacterium]|nr:hypothetical protein [Gemmataceae bacterium]
MMTLDFALSTHLRHLPGSPGILFTRWLPNGKSDAINVKVDPPLRDLKVWLERRGYVDEDGVILCDICRKEVDPSIMAKQERLIAGAMWGSFQVDGVTADELASLKGNVHGDPHYVGFSKKVIKPLFGSLSSFIQILRIQYGQYWLVDHGPWNSIEIPLGNACSMLELKWRTDASEAWSPFRPENQRIEWSGTSYRDFSFYIEQNDWEQIARLAAEGYEASLASQLLVYTHRLLEEGLLPHAVIQGVTALEVGLDEFVRSKGKKRSVKAFAEMTKKYDDQNLRLRTTLIAGMVDSIEEKDLDCVFDILEVRNSLIHDGKKVPKESEEKLRALMRVVAYLIQGAVLKFPIRDPGGPWSLREDRE